MKDSILNSVLIAVTFAAVVFSAIGDAGSTAQTATAQAGPVVTMERTVIVARRLPTETAMAASTDPFIASNAALAASAER